MMTATAVIIHSRIKNDYLRSVRIRCFLLLVG
jgi:hypothetical protein